MLCFDKLSRTVLRNGMLTLHLLVLGINLADHADFSLAPDDFAFFTDLFHRWSNFHIEGAAPISFPQLCSAGAV